MSFRSLSRALIGRRARRFSLLLVGVFSLSLSACISTNTDDRDDALGKGRPGGEGNSPVDATMEAFRVQFWTNIRLENCAGCHGAGQTPQFAHPDVTIAFAASQGFINLDVPGASRVVTYPASGHNPCPPDAGGCAARILVWIEEMQRDIADN